MTDRYHAPRLPQAREWEVTAWTDKATGAVYRKRPDGTYVAWTATSPAGPSTSALSLSPRVVEQRANAGELYASAVSSLAPLVREVLRFREHAEYIEGPPDCLEEECDHFDDDGERVDECPGVVIVVATGDEAIALRQVAEALESYNADVAAGATAADDPAAQYEALIELADRIRTALTVS